ncbi:MULTISPECIES: TetR/AcrR family transcriptional regulator C-terminal domain-containing protein [Streptomyces]|uniref:TetR/AcrR family transcriptional regulator C-terminal domain-containing protein n=1 Tax=Streptomyces TaxID=1883 RepID=UPI0027E3F298|nr:TetR/AcrR family transcriptional regulator C-terminal domain-containing protein [Streptomyces ruber]
MAREDQGPDAGAHGRRGPRRGPAGRPALRAGRARPRTGPPGAPCPAAHRDGAALVVGTHVAEPHTPRFSETLVTALLETGLSERDAARTTWTLLYFTFGLTQEERAAAHQPLGDRLADAVTGTAHPALHRVRDHLAPGSFDGRFEYGLTVIPGRQR